MKHLMAVVVLMAMLLLTACGQPVEGGIILRSADPNLSLFVPVAAAEVGEAEPVTQPPPPCEIIKGNINRAGEKIAHSPGQANYDTVRIDEAAGEKFFCSLEEAEAAGWRAARN